MASDAFDDAINAGPGEAPSSNDAFSMALAGAPSASNGGAPTDSRETVAASNRVGAAAHIRQQGALLDEGLLEGAKEAIHSLDPVAQWLATHVGETTLGGLFPSAAQSHAEAVAGRSAFDTRYGNSLTAQAGRIVGNIAGAIPLVAAGGEVLGPVLGAARALPGVTAAVDAAGNVIQGNRLLRLVANVGRNAAIGARTNLLASGGTDQPLGDTLQQGAELGAGFGALGSAARSISRGVVGSEGVNPLIAAMAQKAEQMGIPIRAGQLSQSPFVKTLDSVLQTMPFSGMAEKSAEQRSAFTKAVSNTIGENTDSITPDVMQAAKDRIGGVFNKVAANTTIKAGDQFIGDLGNVIGEAAQVLGDNTLKPLMKQFDNIMATRQPDGTISGAAYQALTRKDAPLDRLMNGVDPNLQFYAGKLRDTLDDALEQSASPQDLADLQNARFQYKNLKTIEPLVVKGAPGEISPVALAGRVNANFGNRAYQGAGPLGDLADIGQNFIKEVPNSGTEQRSFVRKLLTNPLLLSAEGVIGAEQAAQHPVMAGLALGGSALGLGTGRLASSVLNSQMYRNRLIRSALNGHSPAVQNALVERLAPYGVPASVLGANKLLPSPSGSNP